MAVTLLDKRLGAYRITGVLGSGGMADVYRARHEETGDDVALKLLPREYAVDAKHLARFKREIDGASKLDHPNLCRILDWGEDDGIYYYCMELIEATILEEYLRIKSPVPFDDAIHIIKSLCKALVYIHDQNAVHRDVKPSNIFVRKDLEVVVADFGLLKDVTASTEITGENTRLGTPAYMAPEQFKGNRIDARTDIYQMGIVFYKILTGVTPFEGESFFSLGIKVMTKKIQPPSAHVPDLPEELERIILKAVEKKPEDRYQNARELSNDLNRYFIRREMGSGVEERPSKKEEKKREEKRAEGGAPSAAGPPKPYFDEPLPPEKKSPGKARGRRGRGAVSSTGVDDSASLGLNVRRLRKLAGVAEEEIRRGEGASPWRWTWIAWVLVVVFGLVQVQLVRIMVDRNLLLAVLLAVNLLFLPLYRLLFRELVGVEHVAQGLVLFTVVETFLLHFVEPSLVMVGSWRAMDFLEPLLLVVVVMAAVGGLRHEFLGFWGRFAVALAGAYSCWWIVDLFVNWPGLETLVRHEADLLEGGFWGVFVPGTAPFHFAAFRFLPVMGILALAAASIDVYRDRPRRGISDCIGGLLSLVAFAGLLYLRSQLR